MKFELPVSFSFVLDCSLGTSLASHAQCNRAPLTLPDMLPLLAQPVLHSPASWAWTAPSRLPLPGPTPICPQSCHFSMKFSPILTAEHLHLCLNNWMCFPFHPHLLLPPCRLLSIYHNLVKAQEITQNTCLNKLTEMSHCIYLDWG